MSYSCLDAKVRDIITTHRFVSRLHPVVSKLCQSLEFKQIFCSSLNHDLHVICQRSQILAHGEITAIQKAFAVLMEKEEDLIPAVELYVDEILGLKFDLATDRATTLKAMIQTRHLIVGQAYGSQPKQSSTAADAALPSSSQTALSDYKSDGSQGSRNLNLPHISGEHDETISDISDEKLKRLFTVYHKARKDFDASPAKTLERTSSAKFLRDTTENCLAYLETKRIRPGGSTAKVACDGKILDELRATLGETIAIAEQGSGGKKRRFDENWENVPQEPAQMRGLSVTQPLDNPDLVPRDRISEKKRRPILSRTQEQHLSPKPGYRQQNVNLAERRRSDPPHRLYPASAGQAVRRISGDRHQPHAEPNAFTGRVGGDRYRPTYK